MNASARQRGLTLIELLVALAIFAILALISFRTLSSLFDTRERLQAESGKLRDVALLFARIDADLVSLLDRPVRGADGLLSPSFKLTAQPATIDDAILQFTRVGFADADGVNAAPQRVGYRLREGKLELMLWPGLDQAPRATPQAYAALSNLREVTWRARDAAGNEFPDWPPPGGSRDIYPAALELKLTLISGETLRRLYALRHD